MTVSGMASAVATNGRNGKRRKTYARIPDILPIPDLIKVQIESYEQFKADGLRELFDEISPIESFNGNLKLYFPGSNEEFNQEWGLDFRFEEATYTQEECRERDTTYAAPLYVKVLLDNRDAQEPTVQVQEVYMGDFPIMTENGTFIVNGAERVVVSQLIRSPGAYFTVMEDRATGRQMCMAKLIPNRGAWLEFETSRRDLVSVKVDRKRKIPVTVLLRALGAVTDETGEQYIQEGTDEELLELFATVDNSPDHQFIRTTLEHDTTNSAEEALEDFYRKMRPGDPATLENARTYLEQLLFSPRRYDLGKVGRYKLNRRIGLEAEVRRRTLSKRDIVSIVQHIIRVNNGVEDPDDIDHLGNRRVKTMGELLQNQLRVGFLRMERVVRERMSIRDPEQVSPVSLINIRPVVAVVREFFGGSQLSQFMQQVNPLDELTHKRTLSALGPGGLRRERAGFDVRDVHFSHYGRICPIETPEGPNIGLIGRLATFAEVNEYGFIETPYREVQRVANVPAGQPVEAPFNAQSLVGTILCKPAVDEETGEVLADAGQEITEDVAQLLQASSAKRVEVCRPTESDLLWRTVREPVTHPETGEILVDVGEQITEDVARRLVIAGAEQVRVQPFVTDKIRYLSADEEDQFVIAQANTALDE
ncbi:MAG: DNA-directed RNA polymerase subunit beta, partial [Chloroflexi bacterium]|nr:DNA-directed RNA polymerase subunit beta [Chloroflexota bacterium]